MPIVIQRTSGSGLGDLGQGITGAVQNYQQGARDLFSEGQAGINSMARLALMANAMKKGNLAEEKDARKEAARQAIMQTIGGIDLNSKDALSQLMKIAPQAPDLVAPILSNIRQQQESAENQAFRRQSLGMQAASMSDAQRRWQAEQDFRREAMNKPHYDAKLGGYVTPDGQFKPVQMPEGYKPPAANADFLPMDTSARKEAFELRGQWDEADRVQKELDAFVESGGTGGSGLVLGSLPSTLANRIDPQGTQLRSAMSQMSSVIMNALSGAAVSEQERKRLEGFLPTTSDNIETIQRKMDGYKDFLSTKASSWQGTYGRAKPLEGMVFTPRQAQQKKQPSQAPTSDMSRLSDEDLMRGL